MKRIVFAAALICLPLTAAHAECDKAAITPLLETIKAQLREERILLVGAAENYSDHNRREGYLQRWGYKAHNDDWAAEPKGARTVLNGAIRGLEAYLQACAK